MTPMRPGFTKSIAFAALITAISSAPGFSQIPPPPKGGVPGVKPFGPPQSGPITITIPQKLQVIPLRKPVELEGGAGQSSAPIRDSFMPGETVSLTPPVETAEFEKSGLGAPGVNVYLRADGGSTWVVQGTVVSSTESTGQGGQILPGGRLRPGALTFGGATKNVHCLGMVVPQLARGKYQVWFAAGAAAGPSTTINIVPAISSYDRTVKFGEQFVLVARMVGPTTAPQIAAAAPAARNFSKLAIPESATRIRIEKPAFLPLPVLVTRLNLIQTPITLSQITSVGGNVVSVPGQKTPLIITTDSSGQSRFTLQANASGRSRLDFTAPGFDPIEVNITVGPPPEPPRPPEPLNGFADLHFHWMSHEAWGGRMFAGRPEGPISTAMPWCQDVHAPGGVAVTPEIPHLVGGHPEFDGWPRFKSFFHQQSHIDWVRRAYDRGLRLVSMLAVNNELLPALYRLGPAGYHLYEPTDMNAIHRQIEAMRSMASRNSGWMEIALSPAHARSIVRANKLAIVLGTEVDSLFWRREDELRQLSGNDPARARTLIQAELKKLHDLGVRQITPIHFSDNAFGGPAVFNMLFDFVSFNASGTFFNVETAGPATGPLTFRIDSPLPEWLKWMMDNGWFSRIPGLGPIVTAYNNHLNQVRSVAGGHINSRGLTQYGAILIEEMMKLGMIIDVDHMGEKTTDTVLNMVKGKDYPVISSHTGFREMAGPDPRRATHTAHEGNKSADVLRRIKELGGVVALILDQGDVKTYSSRVANDCPGSTKSFAQSYLYLLDKMDRRNIAIGSDFGGKDVQIGPRFGPFAAHALHDARTDLEKNHRRALIASQTNGVKYVTPLNDYRGYRWEGDAGKGDEHYVWEGIALGQSSRDIDSAPMPAFVAGIPPRTVGTNAWIKDVAKGIRGAKNNVALGAMPGLGPLQWNALGSYWWAAVQRGAYLAWKDPNPGGSLDREVQNTWRDSAVREAYAKIRPIAAQWRAMEGGNAPLNRSVAGNRDFDFNIDGFAHYGLFPDFFQDLKNIGLTDSDLAPLFRSADAYVNMWEKCQRNRSR